jgi:hypothetical protein
MPLEDCFAPADATSSLAGLFVLMHSPGIGESKTLTRLPDLGRGRPAIRKSRSTPLEAPFFSAD